MTYDEIPDANYSNNGIYENFRGVSVTIENNWDLVFHCGSKEIALQILHNLLLENKQQLQKMILKL